MKKLFTESHGVSQYKDIKKWWVYHLEEPIEGYTAVFLQTYAIDARMVSLAADGNSQRDETTPDIDMNGTGNIHPSFNDVRKAMLEPKVRQLVLEARRTPSSQYGVSLPKGQSCDGEVYHWHKADVPAANFYPMILPAESLTPTERRKQEILRMVALKCREAGIPIDENL